MRYAQLDDSGRVVAVVDATAIIDGSNLIQIPDDADVLGKRWDGTQFVEPPPMPQRVIPREEFIDRWSFDELVAIKALAAQASGPSPSTDALEAAVFWEQVTSRDVIHLDSPLAQAAKVALVAWGVLTNDRAEEIFA